MNEMYKISFLDSGVGGLSTLESFYKNFSFSGKQLQVTYFADLKNLPYGNKELKLLTEILEENLTWFEEKKTDLLILACNTSSSLLTHELRQRFASMKILTLLDGFEVAIREQKPESLIIFSTLATHKAAMYINKYKELLPNGKVISVPCPDLVPLIESNLSGLRKKELFIEKVKEYVSQARDLLGDEAPSSFVFGCSHYAFLKDIFKDLLPKSFAIDPSEYLAKKLFLDSLFSGSTSINTGNTKENILFEAHSSCGDNSILYSKISEMNEVISVAKRFSIPVQNLV